MDCCQSTRGLTIQVRAGVNKQLNDRLMPLARCRDQGCIPIVPRLIDVCFRL